MIWCLSPSCPRPQNAEDAKFCQTCGKKLGLSDRYRPIKPLAQGGFGRTFLAIDEYIPSKPRCVIKQLFPQHQTAQQAEKAAQLFHQEAMRLDELGQHEQIPKLLAHLTQEQYQYLILSYIEGQTLAQALAERGVFNEAQVRQVLESLLPVLQFIHDRQIIHRDIKPENIICRQSDGQFVLVDFGASKFATPTNLGKTGTVIGSAGYAAPEQVGGKAVFASDIYSLGVMCIHLLTNIEPFDLYSYTEGVWVWRDYLQTPVSDRLGTVLDRMLELPTSRRYAAAITVLQDLHPQPLNQPAVVPLPAPSIAAQPRSPRPTWRCIHTLAGHSNAIAAIAISPKGNAIASAGFSKTIKVWHLGTGALLSTLQGHTEPVLSLVFSPDGTKLISGSVDDTIKVWHLHTESLLYTLTEHADSILSLSIAISPDGQAIVSGSDDGTVKIWQLGTGHLFRSIGHGRAVTSVAISPDGQRLATASNDNLIWLRNFYTGDLVHTFKGHTRDVNAIAMSPNGQFLVSGSSDHTVCLWDLKSQTLIHTFAGHFDLVRTVAFSPNSRWVASGSGDHTIKLWEIATGKLRFSLTGHTKDVNAIAFSPDGRCLVSGSSDRTIKIWRFY